MLDPGITLPEHISDIVSSVISSFSTTSPRPPSFPLHTLRPRGFEASSELKVASSNRQLISAREYPEANWVILVHENIQLNPLGAIPKKASLANAILSCISKDLAYL